MSFIDQLLIRVEWNEETCKNSQMDTFDFLPNVNIKTKLNNVQVSRLFFSCDDETSPSQKNDRAARGSCYLAAT